jgi:hypothetical protein
MQKIKIIVREIFQRRERRNGQLFGTAGTLAMLDLGHSILPSRDRRYASDEHLELPLSWVVAADRKKHREGPR